MRRANRSRWNAKLNADTTNPKLEIWDLVTSELFEEIKEVKQQLDETNTKAKSLQPELLEPNKTTIFLKQWLEEYDIANKRFHKSLNKKTTQMRRQSAIDKLVRQSQVLGVAVVFQRPDQSSQFKLLTAKSTKIGKMSTRTPYSCWKLGLGTIRKKLNIQCQERKHQEPTLGSILSSCLQFPQEL